MKTYQKISILIIRLFSLGYISYSCIMGVSVCIMAPQAVWQVISAQLGGIVVAIVIFSFASPLASLISNGLDE